MSSHLPALIVIIPLMAALLVSIAGWLNSRFCFPIALTAFFVTLCVSIGLFLDVIEQNVVTYRLGGWDPPWGIVYQIDHLSVLFLVLIFSVSLINLLANHKSIYEDFPDQIGPYYALYMLFITGLSGMVATGDAFNLFVLLEIASLTGYALIGMGDERAPLAGLNYLFMGTIGAGFYLMGIGYLYLVAGTLNMSDLASRLPALYESPVVLLAFALCITGIFIKMALFPLHGWLPGAYTHTSSVTGSLIAPLSTKVMIYVMMRICLSVFTPAYSFEKLTISGTLVWISVIAIIAGSIMALVQTRLKKMLTWIIIAEVGYVAGGFWMGNREAMTGAILHIVNDAVMTLCLFLCASAIIRQRCGDTFGDLKGLFREMPFTMTAFTIGALSIIGVPPACGFFSKWYLIAGGITAGHYVFVFALLFSSLVNALVFFRIIEISYFEPFHDIDGSEHHGRHKTGGRGEISEAPVGMVISMMLVAICLIVLGVYTGDIVIKIIQYAIPEGII
ncbi:MAG: monovalent cation/H+ antiporter subunit D family protein [Desulfobulbaceae bacterium]|nr:monovalent cation/H+ antiporter subunit D family protein [Desulfobulbaceae bacterium]